MDKNLAVLPAYRSEERNSVLAKLVRFAARAEFDDEQKAAIEYFWGDLRAEVPNQRLAELLRAEPGSIAYDVTWMWAELGVNRE